jgi:hypothetical protein
VRAANESEVAANTGTQPPVESVATVAATAAVALPLPPPVLPQVTTLAAASTVEVPQQPKTATAVSARVQDWQPTDVVRWLEGLGLGPYAATFLDNAIHGSNLLELSRDDLKELGVAALGHRMTLSKAIDGLRAGAAT